MSIIEDLGVQVRATSDELPVALVLTALEHFRLASERLRWVRQESSNPMGVPELSAATEHAESAGHALRVAQDQLAGYLAGIGLAPDTARPAATRDDERQPAYDAPRQAPPVPPAGTGATEATPLRRWWAVRVAELTGGREGEPEQPDEQVTEPTELLRRVTAQVRSGDRDRLHLELRRVHADVGMGLATVTPPLMRDLATQMLGHPPRAEDLPRLRDTFGGRVRDLLPGLPPPVLDTVLTRVCRMPPPRKNEDQPHPADPAVVAGVLTALLLQRTGRDVPDPRDDNRNNPSPQAAEPARPVVTPRRERPVPPATRRPDASGRRYVDG